MLAWTIAAFVTNLAVVLITGTRNVPRNDAIKAAGDPGSINVADVRRQFGEAEWVRWNHVRLVLNIASLGCLTWALVLSGRHI